MTKRELIYIAVIVLLGASVGYLFNRTKKDSVEIRTHEKINQEVWRMYDMLEDSVRILKAELADYHTLQQISESELKRASKKLATLLATRPKIVPLDMPKDSVFEEIKKRLK